ncbi:MAG: protease inhibitor I42 family protein [Deltaproteobacteria bacterium]|nr:protease inhibitor I42 family protein [Deltaproteobacteria bacterium]
MAKIMIPQMTRLLLTCLMLSSSPLLAADATITVTQAQAGREIALKVGNILRIELPGKGGAGYNWLAEATGAPYLKLLSQATQPVGERRPAPPPREDFVRPPDGAVSRSGWRNIAWSGGFKRWWKSP